MGKAGPQYDADDFDDSGDDYDDEYDDYDDFEPEKPKPVPKPATQSKLAQTLCAKQPKSGTKGPALHPPTPPNSKDAFQFSTSSPDDLAYAARRANLPGARHNVAKETQPPGGSADSATDKRSGSEATASTSAAKAKPAAASAAALPPYRDTREYTMEGKLREQLRARQPGTKQKLHIVVLGHVDAGKSTLMGRLMHDLGFIDAHAQSKVMRDAEKAGKGSFGWAWALDERPEERARGVTVDVSMQRFQTGRFIVTLLDAPGHRDFVPNMIAGAAQADAALLVVDGSIGGFERGFQAAGPSAGGGGQTREHVQLARSLGVQQLAVVVTKLDTCGYAAERFLEVQSQLAPFLAACGLREGALQWVPACAPTGENVTTPPSDSRLAEWWPHGSTVVDVLDRFHPVDRRVDGPFRLVVSDVFKQRSLGGMAVAGKVEAGAVQVGAKVRVLPANQVLVVKCIEVDGVACDAAVAGDSADIGLAGLEAEHAAAGSVLCHESFPVHVASKLQAKVVVVDTPRPIIPGQAVMVHMHATSCPGSVSRLLELVDPRTSAVVKRNPRMLLKGQTATVEVTLERALCMELPAVCAALGRIVIRMEGSTVAIGKVTEILGSGT